MEDHIAAASRRTHGVRVTEVGLFEPDLGNVRQVLEPTFGQVVQPDHVVAFGDEAMGQARTDEAGGAGDEGSHGGSLPKGCRPLGDVALLRQLPERRLCLFDLAEHVLERACPVASSPKATTWSAWTISPKVGSSTSRTCQRSGSSRPISATPTPSRAAARGCDVIFHQGAMKSVPRSIEEPVRFTEVNVIGTLNVLLAARDAAATVVSASSSSVYGDQDRFPLTEDMPPRPRSPYAATKLAGELFCHAWWASFGVPTVSLRYFNVYGPGQDPASEYAAVVTRFVVACLTGGRPTIYGDGKQARDFTFIDDVVEANLLAARAPEEARGRAFNIGGGAEPTSVNRLLELIAASCGVEPEPVHEPERQGDIRRSEADSVSRAPCWDMSRRSSISDGLRRTVDWFRARM